MQIMMTPKEIADALGYTWEGHLMLARNSLVEAEEQIHLLTTWTNEKKGKYVGSPIKTPLAVVA